LTPRRTLTSVEIRRNQQEATRFAGRIAAGDSVGHVLPVTRRRFGADPAFGSSMLVTASTDILGFSIFRGFGQLLCCLAGLILYNCSETAIDQVM